jgi:hypothetical protein
VDSGVVVVVVILAMVFEVAGYRCTNGIKSYEAALLIFSMAIR